MSISDEFNLSNAQAALAAANTPLYLIRKLKEDQAIFVMARSLSAPELLFELEKSVREKPKTLLAAVVPFVCLVALFMQPSPEFLLRATKVKPSYQDDWFETIRQILVETYQASSEQRIVLPSALTTEQTVNSATLNQQSTILLGG